MRISLRFASASAMLVVAIAARSACADESPATRPLAANLAPGPAGPGNDLGVSPNPRNDTPGQGQVFQSGETPQSAVPPLTGLFPSAGSTLLDHGIDIQGAFNVRFLANPTQCNLRGYGYNLGSIRPFIVFDLQKVIGLPGGSIHFADTFYVLKSNTRPGPGNAGFLFQTGTALNAGYAAPPTESNTLTLLTYEQKLLNNSLSIEGGRTNVHQYFFLPNSIDPFSYDSTVLNVDADFNSITYAQWGGRVNYHVTPAWYLQAGAFQDDYRRAVNYDYRLGTSLTSGAQVLGEVGYRTEFNTAAYPGNLEAGFEWNTRSGLSNIKGTGATALPGRTGANYPGGGVIFVQGLQTIWRGPSQTNSPPKNISLFGYVNPAVDKPQPFDLDAMAGVNFTGFIPGRPRDTIALQAKYQRLSEVEAAFETSAQARAGYRGGPQPRNAVQFEIADRIVVAPWLTITGTAQYINNPDSYEKPNQRRPHDGWAVGTFGTIPFGPLLGTSQKSF